MAPPRIVERLAARALRVSAGLSVCAWLPSPSTLSCPQHIWPQNWGWGDASSAASYEKALTASLAYLDDHVRRAQAIGKPLVVEEFGLARDGQRTDAGGGVERRNAYYGAVGRRASQLGVSGVLPWAWSGEGRPHRPGGYWVAGDAFTGDPPHEPQGWYGILDTDESTLRLLRQMAQAFQHAG